MKPKLILMCLVLVLSACSGATATATDAPALVPSDASTAVPDESTDTPSEEVATEAPAVVPLAPAPTSSGPLAAQVYVANCTSAPTAEKPGNVIVQISVEATGGNGVYEYMHRDILEPDKFIEIPWELGSLLIGKVGVTSGDGQSVDVEYSVDLKTLECP